MLADQHGELTEYYLKEQSFSGVGQKIPVPLLKNRLD
jgi:hypothetical protein